MVVDHNGSERHIRYKSRVASICRRYGYTVWGDRGDEIAIQRDGGKPDFYIDVTAVSGSRILIIEIDGYKGHKTKRAILKDSHRFAEIKEKLNGKPEVFRFGFYQLTPDIPDELIAKELKLIA